MEPFRYVPFSSMIDLHFWQKFSEKKLHELKLSEEPVDFRAEFNINLLIKDAIAEVTYRSFEELSENSSVYVIRGKLFNKNSIESFKSCDKKALLQNSMEEIIECIKSGAALVDPTMLNRMFLLSYADMKKYHFYYWCAFPSVMIADSQFQMGPLCPVQEKLSIEQLQQLTESCKNKMFALVNKASFSTLPFSEIKNDVSDSHWIVFADPSSSDVNVGWILRNLLLMVAYNIPNQTAEFDVIALRGAEIKGYDRSKMLRVQLNKITFEETGLTYVGFEKNEHNQYGPRFANLSKFLDPVVLTQNAVDLNLKLMRWRLAPDLKLKEISDMKCLLLGAGTLGCNVARILAGWGVKHITFVDNGKVSLSNPVRQSLFNFQDALSGGKPKAQTAANALRAIHPGIQCKAVDLTIPMPGHSIVSAEVEAVYQAVEILEKLVEEHNAIFLLLDTREARWLPTLLGAKHRKVVMNAALGFDSYLVMRHGTVVNKLGCYFCNDVVGPMNSTRDRTLDQQCTVTRPGVSYMASAFLVELFASIVQHEHGNDAVADNAFDDEDSADSCTDNILGLVPHQIRMFLSRLHFMTPNTPAFSMCTACSPTVIEEYSQKGFEFLLRAFNEHDFLEEFTGLKAMQELADDIDIMVMEDSLTESSS